MNFIKKIVDKNFDELVHLQFQKFSKGEFRDKALVEIKKTGGKYSIKTSAEFANELVKMMAEKLREKKVKITGAVVSTNNLDGEIEFKEKKQFQGVKRYLIEKEMSGNEIISLLQRFPKSFFALSFEVDAENKLKIKPKAPKSGKPGKGDEDAKADFCTLKTNDSKIGESFAFDISNFKNAKFNHTFFIEEIVIPEELKKSEDFAIIREKSKRKGKIIQKADVDGKKSERTIEFEA